MWASKKIDPSLRIGTFALLSLSSCAIPAFERDGNPSLPVASTLASSDPRNFKAADLEIMSAEFITEPTLVADEISKDIFLNISKTTSIDLYIGSIGTISVNLLNSENPAGSLPAGRHGTAFAKLPLSSGTLELKGDFIIRSGADPILGHFSSLEIELTKSGFVSSKLEFLKIDAPGRASTVFISGEVQPSTVGSLTGVPKLVLSTPVPIEIGCGLVAAPTIKLDQN